MIMDHRLIGASSSYRMLLYKWNMYKIPQVSRFPIISSPLLPMLFKTLLSATLCAFAAARVIEQVEKSIDTPSILARADVTLANGTSMQDGYLANGLMWQSSG